MFGWRLGLISYWISYFCCQIFCNTFHFSFCVILVFYEAYYGSLGGNKMFHSEGMANYLPLKMISVLKGEFLWWILKAVINAVSVTWTLRFCLETILSKLLLKEELSFSSPCKAVSFRQNATWIMTNFYFWNIYLNMNKCMHIKAFLPQLIIRRSCHPELNWQEFREHMS